MSSLEPLVAAAQSGDWKVIKALCRRHGNAIVNEKDSVGRTALHHAIAKKKLAVAAGLVKSFGAKASIPDATSNTALHLAAGLKCVGTDLIRLLVKKGLSEVNAQNSLGETPLHIAIAADNVDTAVFLVEHCGASATIPCQSSSTALHQACVSVESENISTDFIRFLVEKGGADVERPCCEHGRTPLLFLIDNVMCQLCEVNARPGSCAILLRNLRFLVDELGVNVNATDSRRQNALDYIGRDYELKHSISLDMLRIIAANHAFRDEAPSEGPPRPRASTFILTLMIHANAVTSARLFVETLFDARDNFPKLDGDAIAQCILKLTANARDVIKFFRILFTAAPKHNGSGVIPAVVSPETMRYALLLATQDLLEDRVFGDHDEEEYMEKGFANLIRFLVSDVGVSVDLVDGSGMTVIHHLVSRHSAVCSELLEFLVRAGRQLVNTRDLLGRTPLNFLFGSRPHLLDSSLPTPMSTCDAPDASCLTEKAAILITIGGADVSVPDAVGHTPLRNALASGRPITVGILRLLLPLCADDVFTRADVNGRTVLHLASDPHFVTSDVLSTIVEHCCRKRRASRKAFASRKRRASQNTSAASSSGVPNVNAKDCLGVTALHTLLRNCYDDAASQESVNRCCRVFLKDFGADASIADANGDTPLHLAARNFHLTAEILRLMVVNGNADVNAVNKKGETVLHCVIQRAANTAHGDQLNSISDKDLSSADSSSDRASDCDEDADDTPNHCSTDSTRRNVRREGSCDEPTSNNNSSRDLLVVVCALVDYGADLSPTDLKGDTVLDVLVSCPNTNTPDLLRALLGTKLTSCQERDSRLSSLANRRNAGQMTPLHVLFDKHVSKCENVAATIQCGLILLEEFGADATLTTAGDEKGENVLHFAAKNRFLTPKLLRSLVLAGGADVNARDPAGHTAVYRFLRSFVVHEKKVDPSSDDSSSDGFSEYYYLQNLKFVRKILAVLKVLIGTFGADVSVVGKARATLLHEVILARVATPEIIRYLVKVANVPIDFVSKEHGTALHQALSTTVVSNKHLDYVFAAARTLLKCGANPSIINGKNTALHLLCTNMPADPEIVRLLVPAEGFAAPVNHRDAYDRTALHRVFWYEPHDGFKTRYGRYDAFAARVTSLFVRELGADLTITDCYGKSPLDFAVSSKDAKLPKTIRCMLENGGASVCLTASIKTELRYDPALEVLFKD